MDQLVPVKSTYGVLYETPANTVYGISISRSSVNLVPYEDSIIQHTMTTQESMID